MSERYGTCKTCSGRGFRVVKKENSEFPKLWERVECMTCNGQGSAQDGVSFMQRQLDADWEKDRPNDTRWRWIK